MNIAATKKETDARVKSFQSALTNANSNIVELRDIRRLLISNSSIRYDGFSNKWRVVSSDTIKGNVYEKIEDGCGSRQAISICDKEFKTGLFVTSVTGARY